MIDIADAFFLDDDGREALLAYEDSNPLGAIFVYCTKGGWHILELIDHDVLDIIKLDYVTHWLPAHHTLHRLH